MGLPQTTEELKTHLGIITNRVMGLVEIRHCQQVLAELIVEAAEERWPNAFDVSSPHWNDARMDAAWSNARQRWPGVDQIAGALTAAERHIIRDSGPLA